MMMMRINQETNNAQRNKIRVEKISNITIHKDNKETLTIQAEFRKVEITEWEIKKEEEELNLKEMQKETK